VERTLFSPGDTTWSCIKSYLVREFLDFLQIGGHQAPALMELQGETKRGEGDFVGMGRFAAAGLPSPPVRAKFL